MKRSVLAAALLLASVPTVHATALPQSTAFTYQGQLSASGQPATGNYDLTFTLFDAASGGAQVGTVITALQYPVAAGLFTIDLNFPGAFAGQQLWIEVSVGGQILSPRQPVNTVPVAQFSLTGNIGPVGATGATGPTGPTGPTGATGTAPAIQAATYNANGSLSITDSQSNVVTTPNGAWSATGNQASNPASNFIGTTDAQPLVIKTNGTAASKERARFLTTPQIVVNATTALSGDLLAVYGTGYAGATNSIGGQTDYPINAYSTGAFSGVYAENTGTGQGVLGQNTATGVGVYGNNSAGGIGVYGVSTSGVGVFGAGNGALTYGVRGTNQNASGTGIFGLGNNIVGGTVLGSGSGIAANGTQNGAYVLATNVATGVGLIAGGNNFTSVTVPPGTGAGVVGQGENFGIVGYASAPAAALANNKWGGYFDYLPGVKSYAYLAGRSGGVDYGILSTGVKSTMVKGPEGENRVMFATEAPEVLFTDYGVAQLVDGDAVIKLDPLLANAIRVDADHPLKAFVQVEGECNGVYVTNKSGSSFEVRELAGGHSSVTFSWQIVASRADTRDAGNRVTSRFSQVRFPVGPARAEAVPAETQSPPAFDATTLPPKHR